MVGPAGMLPKYWRPFLGGGQVDVAGQHQHRVVRAVPGAEPGLHVIQRRRVEIVHRADHAVVVRVANRIHRLVELVPGLAVGLVLALALLVLHHAALLVQRGLVDRTDQMAHAVRFHPQRHVQRGGRHVLEIVGAVGIGGAVLVGGTHLLERFEELAVVVFAALEHQVFEQVREAGAAGRFVLAAHVIPDVDRDDRRLAIGMHDHAQAVGQGELLVRDIDLAGAAGLAAKRMGGHKRAQGGAEGDGQQRSARAKGERHIRILGHKVNPDPSLRATAGIGHQSLGVFAPPAIPARSACLARHMRRLKASGQCPWRIEWTGVRPADTFRMPKNPFKSITKSWHADCLVLPAPGRASDKS
jgi:hypothetical protein